MTANNLKIKRMVFEVDGDEYQAQFTKIQLVDNTDEAEITYTLEPGEEFGDEADPAWVFELAGVSDWRVNGISTFLTEHKGEEVNFAYDIHPDTPASHVRWTGKIKLRPHAAGGEVRQTEKFELTLPVIGEPVYSRP